jgi:NAD(P)-dependent dehydrogenase (short-subunit alcohol dehydrogenase family)
VLGARSLPKLDDLKAQGADIMELDVTSPLEKLHVTAKKAIAIHGRIDVLVNNTGKAFLACTAILADRHIKRRLYSGWATGRKLVCSLFRFRRGHNL